MLDEPGSLAWHIRQGAGWLRRWAFGYHSFPLSLPECDLIRLVKEMDERGLWPTHELRVNVSGWAEIVAYPAPYIAAERSSGRGQVHYGG